MSRLPKVGSFDWKPVLLLLTLAEICTAPLAAQTDQVNATPWTEINQCLLVANYNMITGKPSLNIINDSESPLPVVCETDFKDDTTVYVTLRLPYTWPSRGHSLPESSFPSHSFHLYVIALADSGHYFVEFQPEEGRMRLVPIRPGRLLKVEGIRSFPANTVMIQMTGNDVSSITELLSSLQPLGRLRILEPGYYSGVPRRIQAAKAGADVVNETVDGRLLAIELNEPLDREKEEALETLTGTYGLTLYRPPVEKGP